MRQCRGTVAAVLAMVIGVGCESPTKPVTPVNSVSVVPLVSLLAPGQTAQYAMTARSSSGDALEGRVVAWSVLDPSVATVSASGLVTALPNPDVGERTTKIRATVEGKIGEADVRVSPSAVASLQLTPYGAVLQEGQAPSLEAVARDAENNLLPGRPVTWTSRDTTVARVSSSGVLTPVGFVDAANRTTRIVVNVGAVADSITITVAPMAVARIVLAPQRLYMQPGWTKALRIEGRTAADNVVGGLVASAYASDNPAAATVTAGGLLTTQPGADGTSQIIATYGSLADTVTLTVNACGAAPAGTYPLEVRFYGPNPPSPSVEAAFTCAASRIRGIITAPVSNTSLVGASKAPCTGEAGTLNDVTAGVIIFAKVDSIDGPGKVLGSAGPCYVRSTSRLPVAGAMIFDSADLAALEAQGQLLDVILHEMLHVIGIGTVWRDGNLNPSRWTGDVANPGFTGARALAACRTVHSGTGVCLDRVPIEDCVAGVPATCGEGTRLGHWREVTFKTELMTGYISSPGVKNPFSQMTIDALADIGYTVDTDPANDYVVPGASLMAPVSESTATLRQLPAPRLPAFEIDQAGRVRPIVPFR